MHCLLYHLPVFSGSYGSLSALSCQGVENTNDVVKQIHHSETRLELGHDNNLSRPKRKYEKSDFAFWEEGNQVFNKQRKKIESEQQGIKIILHCA